MALAAAVGLSPCVSSWNSVVPTGNLLALCHWHSTERERIMFWGFVYLGFFHSTLLFSRPFRCGSSLVSNCSFDLQGSRGLSHAPILSLPLITGPSGKARSLPRISFGILLTKADMGRALPGRINQPCIWVGQKEHLPLMGTQRSELCLLLGPALLLGNHCQLPLLPLVLSGWFVNFSEQCLSDKVWFSRDPVSLCKKSQRASASYIQSLCNSSSSSKGFKSFRLI